MWRNTLIKTIKMKLIIRREIHRRRRGLGKKRDSDQMSLCWKTPGQYLFHSNWDKEKKELEIEKKGITGK